MTNSLLTHQNFDTCTPKQKLALFDLDDTLIKYRPDSSEIFVLYKNTIKKKFEQLNEENYLIAILSNQLDSIQQKEKFLTKIKALMKYLDVPIVFIAALERDSYRKPSPGMLGFLIEKFNVDFDKKSSFYVGDAAGRKFDHSDCDLKLAMNMGVKFFTPEMFFLDQRKDYSPRIIEITKYLFDSNTVKSKVKFENVTDLDSTIKEIVESKKGNALSKMADVKPIIFIYGKGRNSGKSFFGEKYFSDHKVFYNCKDVQIINTNKNNGICFYLNYDESVLRWLKIFSELTGKKSKGGPAKDIFAEIGSMFKNPIHVGFVFDNSKYSEYEMGISKLYL